MICFPFSSSSQLLLLFPFVVSVGFRSISSDATQPLSGLSPIMGWSMSLPNAMMSRLGFVPVCYSSARGATKESLFVFVPVPTFESEG